MSKEIAEKEIAYRKELMQRIISGGPKWTPEERFWALTHSLYNSAYGYPILNHSIETISPNQWYEISVVLESTTEKIDDIAMCISIATGKGKILPRGEVFDNRGKPKVGKPVKMLSLTGYSVGQAETVKYYSDIGLMAVGYGCNYFDSKMNCNSGGYSANGTPNFAMRREVLTDNKIRYYCKHPMKEDFDALVFVIEWNKIDNI